MIRTAALFVALSAAILAAAPPADTFTAEVVGVNDGDTITVLDSAKVQTKIRLHGIDAPELKQAFGARAKEALSSKAFGKSVRIVRKDVDRYGRAVAEVYVDDRLVNREMVADGFAWHYVKYAPNDAALAAAEKLARETKAGLWADAAPVAPWDFRKPAPRPEVPGMVYVTTGGKKYHRADCRHLDASAKAVPIEEAKQTREPCKACKP